MPEIPGLEELRARIAAAERADEAAEHAGRARAARRGVDAVLDLIENGRGRREAGAGLNAASAELLVADALLTEAAALAALDDAALEEVLRELDLEALSARARRIDDDAAAGVEPESRA